MEVWKGVVCPCPPVRDNIAIPRDLCSVMDVGDATSATFMDVVKVDLGNPVGLELGEILY